MKASALSACSTAPAGPLAEHHGRDTNHEDDGHQPGQTPLRADSRGGQLTTGFQIGNTYVRRIVANREAGPRLVERYVDRLQDLIVRQAAGPTLEVLPPAFVGDHLGAGRRTSSAGTDKNVRRDLNWAERETNSPITTKIGSMLRATRNGLAFTQVESR